MNKLMVLVVLAFVACVMGAPAWDLDIGGQAQAAGGFATGVVLVPAMGLGGSWIFKCFC